MQGKAVPHTPFTLKDDGYISGPFKGKVKGPDVDGRIEITPEAVMMFFEGYGNCNMQPSKGSPLAVEVYEGRLVLRVWADINSEDPTHVIDLEMARETARKEDAVPE